MEGEELSKKFARVIAREVRSIWGKSDFYSWPFTTKTAVGIWHEEWVSQATEIFLGSEGEEIAKAYGWPSKLSRVALLYCSLFQHSKIKREKGLEVLARIYDALTILRYDPFCSNFKNRLRVWERKAFEERMVSEVRKEIAFGYGICECLYFSLPNLGFEVHGPYTINSKEKEVVFDYHGIANRFQARVVVPRNSRVRISFLGRLYAGMERIRRAYSTGDLEGIKEEYRRETKVRERDWRELLKKWMEINFRALEPLGGYVPQHLYDRIQKAKIMEFEKFVKKSEIWKAYLV